MKPANPFGLLTAIAIACWSMWSAIILLARPAPPAGIALTLFVVSMPVAWLACVAACWRLRPQAAGRWTHRAVNVALGTLAFAVILGVGHLIGTRLAGA